MGIFDLLFRETSATSQASAEPPKEDKGAVVPSRRVLIGESSEDKALQVGALYHAIDLRATTAARATLCYERFKDDRWQTFSYGDKRRLNWLLQVKPNDRMTADQMWKLAYRMRDIHGHAGIMIQRRGEEILGLIPVQLTWCPTDNTFTCQSDVFNKQWLNVPANNVIVLKGPVCTGYPLGRSLLHYASRTLSLAATGENLCLDVIGKGGTFKAIVKQEQQINGVQGLANFDDTEVKKNTDTIGDQFSEGKDFIYDPSASEITPITQSFQDLQVDLQRNKAIEDIARFTGVPLPLMFCATNAVYKSIDDAWHTFKELTIQPILDEVEQELNAKLLTYEDFGSYRYRFDTTALCLDTDKGKAEVAQIYINSRVKTVNEVRHELNLSPLEEKSIPSPQPTQPTATEGEEGGEE